MKNNDDCFICLCSVEYSVSDGRFVNPGFNKIISSYSRRVKNLHVVGFCTSEQNRVETKIAQNVVFSSVNKSPTRLGSYLNLIFSNRLNNIIGDESARYPNNTHVQLRIPSITGLLLLVKSLVKINSLYVAGDWIDAARHNNKMKIPAVVICEYLQRIVIARANIPIVVAGKTLANKYAKYGSTHTFRSTTHSCVEKRVSRSEITKIIYVGTFEKRKRAVDLIEAMQLLVKDSSVFHLTLIGGGGTQETSLKTAVSDKDLASHVTFVGVIDDEEQMAKYYREADILVLPSLSEGSPRVLPEAMSFGVIPIAVRDISSNNHIIDHMGNGFLVEKKNPNDISEKINRLVGDSELYEKCLLGIFNYSSNHTIDNELEAMWKFIGIQ